MGTPPRHKINTNGKNIHIIGIRDGIFKLKIITAPVRNKRPASASSDMGLGLRTAIQYFNLLYMFNSLNIRVY